MARDSEEFLRNAIHSEIAARDAYRGIAGRVESPDGKRVLESMSEEEDRHREMLAARFESKFGSVFEYDPGLQSGPDFTFIEKSTFAHTDALEALRLCLGAEIDAIHYYSDELEAAKDPTDRKMLRSLVKFERRHKRTLEREIKRLETENHWKL